MEAIWLGVCDPWEEFCPLIQGTHWLPCPQFPEMQRCAGRQEMCPYEHALETWKEVAASVVFMDSNFSLLCI